MTVFENLPDNIVHISVPAPTQKQVFKTPMGKCMATTLSSLSLTSNRVTTNC